jgi:hypothetical protein
VVVSLWCLGALGFEQEENMTFSSWCPGALGFEQEEKVALSP